MYTVCSTHTDSHAHTRMHAHTNMSTHAHTRARTHAHTHTIHALRMYMHANLASTCQLVTYS